MCGGILGILRSLCHEWNQLALGLLQYPPRKCARENRHLAPWVIYYLWKCIDNMLLPSLSVGETFSTRKNTFPISLAISLKFNLNVEAVWYVGHLWSKIWFFLADDWVIVYLVYLVFDRAGISKLSSSILSFTFILVFNILMLYYVIFNILYSLFLYYILYVIFFILLYYILYSVICDQKCNIFLTDHIFNILCIWWSCYF